MPNGWRPRGCIASHVPLTLATDVVLLDLDMPDVVDFEVARQLRGDPRYDATRLIALAGWNQAIHRAPPRAASTDTNPADFADLHAFLMVMPRRNEP